MARSLRGTDNDRLYVGEEPSSSTILRSSSPSSSSSSSGGDASPPVSSGAHRRFDGGAPTILIVDDNEDNRELYSMILDHLGYPIVLAVDGIEAVERARDLNPAVILMDLAMPNMDGFEATRLIRELPGSDMKTVPIIAVTAFTDSLSAQRALAAGANEVLTKPCPPSQLSARVEAALESQKTSRSA